MDDRWMTDESLVRTGAEPSWEPLYGRARNRARRLLESNALTLLVSVVKHLRLAVNLAA